MYGRFTQQVSLVLLSGTGVVKCVTGGRCSCSGRWYRSSQMCRWWQVEWRLAGGNRSTRGKPVTAPLFFRILVGWDFWYCGHYWPIVPAPDDRWWRLWRNCWNEDWQVKPKYSGKTCHSATLSSANPTWLDLGTLWSCCTLTVSTDQSRNVAVINVLS
jgi:hypothetical protein